MEAAIGAAGRIVVPKPLREALGLKPGQPLDIRVSDGGLTIEIATTPPRERFHFSDAGEAGAHPRFFGFSVEMGRPSRLEP